MNVNTTPLYTLRTHPLLLMIKRSILWYYVRHSQANISDPGEEEV